MRKLFPLLIFLSAAAEIYAEYFSRQLVYIFKPLTMVLIIVPVFIYTKGTDKIYRRLILAGLFFSLVGDIFLINSQYFVFGLASFLLAHLCYTGAFIRAVSQKFNPLSLTAYLIGLI